MKVVISSGLDAHAFALDANTGNELWINRNFDQFSRDDFNPVYADGNVLISTPGLSLVEKSLVAF